MVLQFDLVDAKELEPLKDVITNLIKKDPSMSRHLATPSHAATTATNSTAAAATAAGKEEDLEVLQR